jgi:putative phosphoesterase
LPPAVDAALPRCDVVLHAGDVVTHHLLDHLRTFAPVIAVLGNNDVELRGVLPERVEVDLGGVHLALVHETGAAKGRPARVRRWFPDAEVVVFGHSHTPMNDWHDGQLLFNPGSAVERRREPVRTYGLLDLADGRVTRHEIVLVTEVTG